MAEQLVALWAVAPQRGRPRSASHVQFDRVQSASASPAPRRGDLIDSCESRTPQRRPGTPAQASDAQAQRLCHPSLVVRGPGLEAARSKQGAAQSRGHSCASHHGVACAAPSYPLRATRGQRHRTTARTTIIFCHTSGSQLASRLLLVLEYCSRRMYLFCHTLRVSVLVQLYRGT